MELLAHAIKATLDNTPLAILRAYIAPREEQYLLTQVKDVNLGELKSENKRKVSWMGSTASFPINFVLSEKIAPGDEDYVMSAARALLRTKGIDTHTPDTNDGVHIVFDRKSNTIQCKVRMDTYYHTLAKANKIPNDESNNVVALLADVDGVHSSGGDSFPEWLKHELRTRHERAQHQVEDVTKRVGFNEWFNAHRDTILQSVSDDMRAEQVKPHLKATVDGIKRDVEQAQLIRAA